MRDPRVVGATPLDSGLKSGHPSRGASFPTLHDELDDICKAQMRHPLEGRPGLTFLDLPEVFLSKNEKNI